MKSNYTNLDVKVFAIFFIGRPRQKEHRLPRLRLRLCANPSAYRSHGCSSIIHGESLSWTPSTGDYSATFHLEYSSGRADCRLGEFLVRRRLFWELDCDVFPLRSCVQSELMGIVDSYHYLNTFCSEDMMCRYNPLPTWMEDLKTQRLRRDLEPTGLDPSLGVALQIGNSYLI